MGKFKQLPNWCFTTLKPAFYDLESLTAVEQTGRLYKTIQDLIDDYNKCVNEINTTINEFLTTADKDQAEFECKINKIIHDYIITIDSKIAHQDRKIDDAINNQESTLAEAVRMMTTNLTESVQTVVNEMKESGELSEDILNAFDETGVKLSTLETTVTGLESRATTLENDVSNLESRATTLENDVSNLESRATTLENDVSEAKLDLQTIETDVNNLKGNFAVLTGTLQVGETVANASINYPSGFNMNNCVIISVLTQPIGANHYVFSAHQDGDGEVNTYLLNDNIGLSLYSGEEFGFTYTGINYKITLMKIS